MGTSMDFNDGSKGVEDTGQFDSNVISTNPDDSSLLVLSLRLLFCAAAFPPISLEPIVASLTLVGAQLNSRPTSNDRPSLACFFTTTQSTGRYRNLW